MEMRSLDNLAKLEEKKVGNPRTEGPKGWRYTPYSIANYGGSELKDQLELGKKSNSTTRECSFLLS